MRPISEISSPFMPLVAAPIGYTLQLSASLAFLMMPFMTAALSAVGLVLGMQQIDVYPPFAALAVPVAMVSLYSPPGSLKWQCMSTRPGVTVAPLRSITLSALSSENSFANFPSSINTLEALASPKTLQLVSMILIDCSSLP